MSGLRDIHREMTREMIYWNIQEIKEILAEVEHAIKRDQERVVYLKTKLKGLYAELKRRNYYSQREIDVATAIEEEWTQRQRYGRN